MLGSFVAMWAAVNNGSLGVVAGDSPDVEGDSPIDPTLSYSTCAEKYCCMSAHC